MKSNRLLPVLLLLLLACVRATAGPVQPYKTPKEGDLIQAGGAISVIQGGERCGIPNMEVFRASGFKAENVIRISDDDERAIPEGPVLTAPVQPYKTPREGDLIQAQAGGPVFVIRNDVRHAIPNMEVFRANGFQAEKIIKVSDEDMGAILAGDVLR